ncbi:RTX toxin and Ca2+-binding protein [Desmospora sp. 8437]|nr:RTX toxin and Ca2+-binding protein [Desmospora sp. 8437]
MFTFAGKHLTDDFGLTALDIQRSLGPEIEAITEKIPGRRGVSDQGIEEGALEITVPFYHKAPNMLDLRAHMRQVWAWLRNGGQMGELVFDDEPGLKYMARVVGLTELDELVSLTQGEVTFLIPDPDALGKMDEQRIAGLGVGQVDSTPEDFAKGTLSNVTTETRAGQTDLILAKYGDPWQSTIRTNWDLGTYDEMMKAPDGKLTLKRGSGAKRKINTTAGWNDYSSRSNTKGASNKLVLDNIPTYYFQDDMSAWKGTGWNDTWYAGSRKGKITQETGYMRLDKTGTGNDSTVMVFKERETQAEDRTVLLHVRTTSAGCRFQLVDAFSDQRLLWNVYIPNTGDQWTWFRIDYADRKTATLYELGNPTPVSSVSEGINTTAVERFAFILGDADTGRIDVDAVYYGKTTSFPAVTETRLTGYSRYIVDLSDVGVPSSGPILYSWSKKTGVVDDPQMVTVRSRIHKGGSSTPWKNVTNWGQVPDLLLEAPYSEGDFLEVEVTLSTTDLGYSPDVTSLEVNIESAYPKSGSWRINYTSFRHITRVIKSKINFEANVPSGTRLEVLATWRIGGQTYGPFPCTSGNPIPYLTNRLDLSNATLEIQVNMETDSNTKSPELSLLQLEMEPGYKSDTDGIRTAPGVEIGSVEVVGSSRIWWEDENPDPSKTDVRVYVGYSKDGPWTEVENGAPIPGAEPGEDVTGKTLFVRTVLRTSDPTLTPRLQVIGWEVSQETKTDLINEGTAPADAIFSGTFSSPAEYVQILHIQSGRRVTLNYPFEAGDEVEIDCEMGRVRINGSARDGQTAMSFNSRWIEVHPGYNSFEVTPSGVGEFFCEWRERWL